MNQQRLIAIIQLAGSAVALLIALLIAYNGWNRWSGIGHINSARTRMAETYDESVRRHASAAAVQLPNEAAAVLLDVDLAKDADYARLEKLERKVDGRNRALVQTAEALSLVLRGKPAPDVAGSDGVLLKVLSGLAAGVRPSPIVLDKGDPPHQALAVLAYSGQLRAAFAANDRRSLAEASGALAALVPGTPQGALAAFVCGALDAEFDPPKLRAIADRVKDRAQLQDAAHRVAALAPDRAPLLDSIALGVSASTPPDKVLDAQVQAAVAASGTIDAVGLARRCFAAGRPDLAKLLIPKLPADAQAAFRNLVLNQEGDVGELAKLGAASPAIAPRLSTPRCPPGLIAFHVSNDLGLVPKSALTENLDGDEVPPAKITHTGTLFSIQTTASGPLLLEVAAKGAAIFTGKVTL
jgi:hypothetical protein